MSNFICFGIYTVLEACKKHPGRSGGFCFYFSLLFFLISCSPLYILYQPLYDPSSSVGSIPLCPYCQYHDKPEVHSSINQQLLSEGVRNPQHWQQYQPWPTKMFLGWYSWHMVASLTKLAVTTEKLPGRFSQKEIRWSKVQWWKEYFRTYSHFLILS